LSARGDIGGLVDWALVADSEPHTGVRARRVDTAGTTLVRYEFQPGAAYPRHQHLEEQLVHVLSGSIELDLGGETFALAAGDLVHVAGGVPHGARGGEGGAVFLNVVVPRRL
jgi:quercetin dioxygenase-like cupin family protein